jgi:hypothetical protein
MSIDVYSYPIKMQSLDPKSHRTSLQKGGFSSMMDVLNQNEVMNQRDNDAFTVPEEEAPPLPHLPQNVAEDFTVKKEAAPVIDKDEGSEDVTVLKNEVEVMADVIVVPHVVQAVEFVDNIVIEDGMAKELDIPLLSKTEVTAKDDIFLPEETDKAAPVAFSAPKPVMDLPDRILEVDKIEDVPDVLEHVFPEILSIPNDEGSIQNRDMSVPLQKEVLPEQLQRTMVLPTNTTEIEKKESMGKSHKTPLSMDRSLITPEGGLVEGVDLEEDSRLRFVRYVEEEIVKPTFQSSEDRMHVPEGMQEQQENSILTPSAVAKSTVSGVDKSVAQSVTKSDSVQTNTMLEKNTLKEEVKLPKQKIQQSFAKLLKQAKELAEDFEPKFHADILKKLEIQIKDPAGIIHLEVAQKEAIIHVRAIVPMEAMSDLHYLGQDMSSSLQDLGLQLGSYELRSQDDNEEGAGFSGIEETGLDDLDEAEELQSDYVVDKRI